MPLLALLVVSLPTPSLRAANSVAVGSVAAAPGDTGVTVPVLITNDVQLSMVIIPLVIRQVFGDSYISSLQVHLADRLGGPPPEILFTQIRRVDGVCGVEGLGTVLFDDQSSHAVTPVVGAELGWQIIFSAPLEAGADATGSLLLTVDVPSTPAIFEIDATCGDPAHELWFANIVGGYITPAFQMGILTVGVIFHDGFESAGTDGWSTAVP